MIRTALDPVETRVDMSELEGIVAAVCRTVAPTWPLDRFIAVNPHWGRIAEPFEQVGRRLARLSGSRLWMPREYYLDHWQRGGIAPKHLQQALTELAPDSRVADAVALLHDAAATMPLPLLTDCLDAHDGERWPTWREAITHQVSQHCAAHFDADQSDWRPGGSRALYAAWLDTVRHDHGMACIMHAPGWTTRVQALPGDALTCIAQVLEQLRVPSERIADVLEAALGRLGGWAAWCAYLRWQAELAGRHDDSLEQLLAIVIASEALADDGERGTGSPWQAWQARLKAWGDRDLCGFDRVGPVWQRAHELAFQERLLHELSGTVVDAAAAERPNVQAVFCIDVRSEVFRRALEQASPAVQTLGFAGFFGLPIAYTPLGTEAVRPQLPGLLTPTAGVTDTSGSPEGDDALRAKRRSRLQGERSWDALGRWPASAFAWVETSGLAYVTSLVRRGIASWSRRTQPDRQGLRPSEADRLQLSLRLSTPERVRLAAQALRGMSLTSGYARLVLLVGHGSTSANNPHAAGLDCGACCGQTGEINARALAAQLNDPDVRRDLRVTHGLEIPDDTWFVAALHDTTLDEVRLFDLPSIPATHSRDVEQVVAALELAGRRARAERAGDLGLPAEDPAVLHAALRRRARDWAQTRPEWGLANNAAFIAAPRRRTQSHDLRGRAFLHEYDWQLDQDGSVLELILTAPVVVAHWINLQYFASTVDPRRFGSGNKVLHNVVGGRIGVFEGNGGDLRIGLPLQSVHDGRRWMHEPLRLCVFVAAPRAALERVVAKHEVVRQLVGNRWIHLFRLDDDGSIERFTGEAWLDVTDRRLARAA